MVDYCYICYEVDRNSVIATHFCSELHKPVCAHHAAYCKEDGHFATKLEEMD